MDINGQQVVDRYRTRMRAIVGRDTEEASWDAAFAEVHASTAEQQLSKTNQAIEELQSQVDELAAKIEPDALAPDDHGHDNDDEAREIL